MSRAMYTILRKIAEANDFNPELFIQLISKLRPRRMRDSDEIERTIEDLIHLLGQDPEIREGLSKYLAVLFRDRKFSTVITDLGIIKNVKFFSEVKRRFFEKLLPIQYEENTMSFILNQSFVYADDIHWVSNIREDQWVKLFELLQVSSIDQLRNQDFYIQEFFAAVEILSLRISGLGMDQELLAMAPELSGFESPFITLNKESFELLDLLRRDINQDRSQNNLEVKQVFIIINQCRKYVDQILKNREKFGITFETTLKIVRLNQTLDRLELTLRLMANSNKNNPYETTITFIQKLAEFACRKNDITSYIDYTTRLVAFQVTQHTGKTGEHYITSDWKEYKNMLKSALGGGAVVGLLCLIKAQLSYLDLSPLGMAFLYSMNYAIGFIALYLLGFTLATKQPAMTAATIAKTLDGGQMSGNYPALIALMERIFRSQFIAFIGNVVMAFPVALLFGFGYEWAFGESPITPNKAEKLLSELHPLYSLSLFHASIAGFYLFLSGQISGAYINSNIHHKISLRIANHPLLRNIMSESALKRVARFYDQKIGGLSGNFWLGVFLGSTGMVGYFIGLPIDIRHITFGSGNLALSLVGYDFDVAGSAVFIAFIGVVLIGFFNFVVSFSLSLIVALRSRNIPLSELGVLLILTWQNFRLFPKHYFIPPRES